MWPEALTLPHGAADVQALGDGTSIVQLGDEPHRGSIRDLVRGEQRLSTVPGSPPAAGPPSATPTGHLVVLQGVESLPVALGH